MATAPQPGNILTYVTGEEHHGQAVKFSPYHGNRIACATGTEYGMQGEGFLYVLERDESGQLQTLLISEYKDNLFDVCWSETDPNILTTAAGDGFIQVWNLSTRFPKVPVHEFKGHKKEMSSVEWCNGKFGNTLLASSWDGTVCCVYCCKYDMSGPWPLIKMPVSELIVYQATWSPHTYNVYASVSQDGILQVWDMGADNQKAQIYLHVSDSDLLTCDWAKYTQNFVVTGGTDCTIKGWDLRNYSQPVFNILDHGHAVKRVKFSPYLPTVFASVSYDMSLRIFDYHVSDQSLEIISEHSEFVYGLDWNFHVRNQLATCSWDKTLKILTPNCLAGK